MDLTTSLAILKKASQQEKLRLKRGKMRREQMLAAQENGVEPSGPRAEWLRSTSMALMKTLEVEAKRFNDANLDDMVSAADLCDALASAIALLQEGSAR